MVIRDDAVLTTEPLRYPDEFVRHKMLDIVGDLSLLGRPLRGHLIAVKPSHAANCELVRRDAGANAQAAGGRAGLRPAPGGAQGRAAAGGGADETTPQNGAMDIQACMELLPHRYPFLMVDRVVKIEGNHIVGVKNVTINEPYFQGHFPGHPVMPGVLQLEAMAQVAGIVMLKTAENSRQDRLLHVRRGRQVAQAGAPGRCAGH